MLLMMMITMILDISMYFSPRFMRHVKKVNPEKRCFLQYDKLFIDGKVFMFNESNGKVQRRMMRRRKRMMMMAMIVVIMMMVMVIIIMGLRIRTIRMLFIMIMIIMPTIRSRSS